MKLSGWGRYPQADCAVFIPRRAAELGSILPEGRLIARGMGRAYGDSALNSAATIDMTRLNRLLSFDKSTGLLVAEAGVALSDIIDVFLPQGFFPPVTPGTKYVSLGGMIAADVHGKNHHNAGSVGNFIDWLDIVGPSGQIMRCSRDENSELFEHSIGGMGLTGVILRAAIRLKPVESCWIKQKTIACANLDELFQGFESYDNSTYSVAWVDCLSSGAGIGRSLLYVGEHAVMDDLPQRAQSQPLKPPARRRLSVPFNLPSFTLNRYSVKLFNQLYFYRGAKTGEGTSGWELVDYESYFYPLDSILHWNRIYGRRGFLQFQTVLPLAQSRDGIEALLATTAAAGQGSFLSVLKKFGAQQSAFSFPMEGYTLTLDFPARRGTFALIDKLTEIAIAHGGRFYLAKDARLTHSELMTSDKRAAEFKNFRQQHKLDERFASLQSERLRL
jgi:FAD/FMN-containing dehydrogenase